MNKRKTIIIVIIIGTVFLFVFYLLSLRKQKQNPALPIASPKITNYIQEKFEITTTITKDTYKLPETLSFLKINSTQLLNGIEIRKIGQNLGFPYEPNTADDITDGKVYFFNNNLYSLTITPKNLKLTYNLNSSFIEAANNATNKQLSEKDYIQIGQDFLTKLSLNKEEFVFSSISYFKFDKGLENPISTSKEQTVVFQVNFSPKSSQYELLTVSPEKALYFVQILKDGSVVSAEATLINSFIIGETKYKLKSFAEFLNSLNAAILVSLNDNNTNLPDISTGVIESAIIKEIKIVYLLDQIKNKEIQPVFLLSGSAKLKDTPSDTKALFYLPAFSNNP